MKKKNKMLVIGALFVLLVGAIWFYISNERSESKVDEVAVFTKQELSEVQVDVLVSYLYMTATPSINAVDRTVTNKSMKLASTEDTKKAVTVLNYYLFDDLSEYDKNAFEKAKEYGFDKEKRLTLEWIMDHNKKTFDILYGLQDNGSIFSDKDAILRTYTRITEKDNNPK
ncbi:hypothetical protein HB825_12940 [Listeria booriae]|uniref:Uncharacterized protein n=1 Tax=Listeria booriae TaxID=1552123 RepID=A0A7X0ZW01_9LIST|nr:hypothetical protein [Listeria booriae]MBC1524363.1 hypothetical protein [Listeria booriae]MBC1530877.1 hypothetical protein [Listeria booriae]MBC2257583.1 hypothetical protein [Listeria booriae]MBC2283048.1 hypothetical protein [Listeria booriae]MBC2292308.1 hypothetical protein [Listeria booriae]